MATIAGLIVLPISTSATTIEQLEKQITLMQAQIAELKAAQQKQSEATSNISTPDNVTWGGTVEFEYNEGGAGNAAKVELEASIQATKEVAGYIKLKADNLDTSNNAYVDEVSVTYDTGFAAFSATTGGHPFGDFSSSMISDSLTKTIGDTGGTTKLLVEIPVNENLTISAAADDNIESINATATIGDLGITVSHISDVEVDATKSANHLAASYSVGDLSLFAESVDSDGSADATNVELAYSFSVAGHDAGVAIGRQERKVTSAEKLNMVSATVNIAEGLDLTVEHKDSDNNANDAWLGQVSYGF